MGISASRALFAALFVGAVYASLSPHARVEATLDLALTPARALAELAAPLSWMQFRTIRAAESALAERAGSELAARSSFETAERNAALPATAALREQRRFVHATVVGRREQHFDSLVIEPDGHDVSGLEPGLPVVAGDAFVGRIAEIEPPPSNRVIVELVTAKTFTVGALLEPLAGAQAEPIRLVAGGVVTARRRAARRELAIAVHNPSRSRLHRSLVRVDESFAVLERFAEQARGFELGTLEERDDGEWAIRPRLDYAAGLFQVAIVCPPESARPDAGEPEDILFDGHWREARVLSRGEPSLARTGLKLGVGEWQGARTGSAVVAGVRLVGLVARVAPLWSDVRTLDDPGLALPVVASVEGCEQPVALGRLQSLGRARSRESGDVRMRWDALMPLDGDASTPRRKARLFTASGSPLVPRGLLLGECELPAGPGPHELVVRRDVEPLHLGKLWLRASGESESRP